MNTRNQILLLIAITLGIAVTYQSYRLTKTKTDMTNTIIVGTETTYPPFSFVTAQGEIVGFDIDIARYVIQKLGKTMIIKNMSFEALIPEIQLGTIHIIAAGMSPTPKRAEQVHFTKPYISGDPLLIISLAKQPAIENVTALQGKYVAVNLGFTADMYMSEQPGVYLQRLTSVSDGFLALNSGQVDAFVVARSAVQPVFAKHDKRAYHIFPIAGQHEKYALAISKKYPKLLPQIQAVLDTMEQDGTLNTLKQKWNLQ